MLNEIHLQAVQLPAITPGNRSVTSLPCIAMHSGMIYFSNLIANQLTWFQTAGLAQHHMTVTVDTKCTYLS